MKCIQCLQLKSACWHVKISVCGQIRHFLSFEISPPFCQVFLVPACICIPNQVPFCHSKPIGRNSNPFVMFRIVAKVKTWCWFVTIRDIIRVNECCLQRKHTQIRLNINTLDHLCKGFFPLGYVVITTHTLCCDYNLMESPISCCVDNHFSLEDCNWASNNQIINVNN